MMVYVKKIREYLQVFILLLVAMVFSFVAKNSFEKNIEDTLEEISIALYPAEGMEICSQNPVTVSKGEQASFEVKISDEYFIEASNEYYYENGYIVLTSDYTKTVYPKLDKYINISIFAGENGIVSGVTGKHKPSVQYELTVKPDDNYHVSSLVINDTEYPAPATEVFYFTPMEDSIIKVSFEGNPLNFSFFSNNSESTVLEAKDEYHYGDEIIIHSEINDENINFLGYSTEGYLWDNGKLLSDSLDYTFKLTEDSMVFANFQDKNAITISINPNGGKVNEVIDMSELSQGNYVNLPVDKNFFTREGYSLTGYNTKADGTGIHYSLGSMMVVPNMPLNLYAEWEKQTEEALFSYAVEGNSITVLGFESSDTNVEKLVIPAFINNMPVKKISKNAFKKGSFKIALIPVGVEVIEDYAFSECKNLTKIYLPETLTNISSNAFKGSEALETLNVLASLDRVYDYSYNSTLADKYLKMVSTEGKRIILVSGSSLAFGIKAGLINEKFPEYTVINLGCSYLFGIIPLFDIVRSNVRPGDIVIFMPEYRYGQYANTQVASSANWEYLESNYNILEDLDLRYTTNILPYFGSYLANKRNLLPGKLIPGSSVFYKSSVNSDGEVYIKRNNLGVFKPEIPTTSLLTDYGMNKYNDIARELTEKGAKCMFSFAPLSMGEYSKEYLIEATADFNTKLREKIDDNYMTVISDFGDYLFDYSLFYDNCFHMTLNGAELRTKQLISDLVEYGGM